MKNISFFEWKLQVSLWFADRIIETRTAVGWIIAEWITRTMSDWFFRGSLFNVESNASAKSGSKHLRIFFQPNEQCHHREHSAQHLLVQGGAKTFDPFIQHLFALFIDENNMNYLWVSFFVNERSNNEFVISSLNRSIFNLCANKFLSYYHFRCWIFLLKSINYFFQLAITDLMNYFRKR